MATDIIARGMITEYIAGTNINFTENRDGTVEISASGSISSEDSVARDAIGNHKSDTSNPHNVTPAQIGLGNVDNTSDLDKPISTAVQKAIDNKADKTVATTSADGLMSAEDKGKLDNADNTYALKAKYGDTTIDVGRKAGTTVGINSTAEGYSTEARGDYSHAEGSNTTSGGDHSHAEGFYTIALGIASHAEGNGTLAEGLASHASGTGTKALKSNESAFGCYNKSNDDTLFSVGDGTDNARHNAFEITTTGGKLHDKDIATVENISNPNLLINPDFKINQRGDNSYTSSSGVKYTVDRWVIIGTCTPTSTGVTVSADGSAYGYGSFYQLIENYISNQVVTLSAKVNGKIYHFTGNTSESSIGRINITDENGNDVGYVRVTNNNVRNAAEFIIYQGCQMKIEWVKLEYGSIATPFVSPEPITELLKCQRYYQVRSENNIAAVDLRPNMRDGVVPTITALDDGNYSYEAEVSVS